ncbi:MAG: nucleotidyl transferase AbiEii/AbiGii toxin family protein [Gammaproteobacteria bacterium]|nr:nucleotidyl transferase AbiEii/AbiGii toxin family protein [Gammaproteobacteria bacterium]
MQDDLRELIKVCSEFSSLPARVIEKDYYLTQVIHLLSDIQDDHFSFVFQGGTALAKAHKIVDRMSEKIAIFAFI